MALQLRSTAFKDGGDIPESHTIDGKNSSPPLQWTGVPDETESFALIVDDPDGASGIWVHWVLFNIPADSTSLDENLPLRKKLEYGIRQGINDFRKNGYGGPCPPKGAHHYHFKFYALDEMLDLPAGANKIQLLRAMEDHILDESMLIGTYSR